MRGVASSRASTQTRARAAPPLPAATPGLLLLSRGDHGVDARADLQHGADLARARGRRVHRPYLAEGPVARELLGRLDPGPLVSGALLAPVRQQLLHRRDGDILRVARSAR